MSAPRAPAALANFVETVESFECAENGDLVFSFECLVGVNKLRQIFD